MRRGSGIAHVALLLALGASLAGCERTVRNMYDQPKLKEATTSPLFADGLSARPAPSGTVPAAVGIAATNASGRAVSSADAASGQRLARGEERHTIYCAPCHGRDGRGDGIVVQRGFPPPPAYSAATVRQERDDELLAVIAAGKGVMPAFADRIDEGDRSAVAAWVRHLQNDDSVRSTSR